MAARAAYSKE